ncbi:MAG: hypothetical protein M1821_000841 [Bathelium mastoideum]|nr:MAG: hypothetical protein M1821_000841 [Bathelium mastoideum]
MDGGSASPGPSGWRTWFPNGQESGELEEARKVRNDHHDFLEIVPKLREPVKSELAELFAASKKESTARHSTQDNLLTSLNAVPLNDLELYVAHSVQGVIDASSELRRKRDSGARKYVSTPFQKFAKLFSDFLAAYGGLVDILRNADSQYGNVASSTFSLLFAVVKNKAKAEDHLHRCLKNITEALPNLEIYKKVFPDRVLGRLLSEVYKNVILFGREATTYLLGHGFGTSDFETFEVTALTMRNAERVQHALGHPYKFQSSEATIRQRLVAVHHRCDALLADQVVSLQNQVENITNQSEKIKNHSETIKKQNDDLAARLKHVEKENSELKALQVSSRIAQLRNTLNIQELTHEEREDELQKYRFLLDKSFSPPQRPSPFRISDLESAEEYKRWKAASASVLVVRGTNHRRLASERNSWLSPVAVHMIQSAQESQQMIAYFLCDSERTHKDALSSILVQVLEKSAHRWWSKEDDDHFGAKMSRSSGAEAVLQILIRAVQRLPEPLIIVIDRPEVCAPTDLIREGISNGLVRLAREVGSGVRVLAVQRSEYGNPAELFDDGRMQSDDPRDLYHVMERNQDEWLLR